MANNMTLQEFLTLNSYTYYAAFDRTLVIRRKEGNSHDRSR